MKLPSEKGESLAAPCKKLRWSYLHRSSSVNSHDDMLRTYPLDLTMRERM